MPDLTDISCREDIEAVLRTFYTAAFSDPLIGRFFTKVVPLDLSTHLPVIADFWESVLFHTHGYRKNVMHIHQQIDGLSKIRKEHLDRWVHLFTTTVDESFSGPRSTLMKQRAQSIATLMDMKLNHPHIQ